MPTFGLTDGFDDWLTSYRIAHAERLRDADFAAWLETDYIPIAGGWQY
jgi:hypothetical protein